MELTNKQIETIFRTKISPNDAIFLKQCQEGNKEIIEMFNNYNINISMTLLTNGYITVNETLTQKGIELVGQIWGKQQQKSSSLVDYKALHGKLQAELKQLTGKQQKVLQGKYSYLCNARDLEIKLSKIIKKYDLKDVNKIEKTLMNYIYKCYKANFEYCQIIEYYLEKNNTSKFVSDYENFDEKTLKREEKTGGSEILI